MNIHIRIDCTNATHTHFTVFIDDVYCGALCVTNEEFDRLTVMSVDGLNTNADPPDTFKLTGNTWEEVQQARAALMGDSR